MILVFIWDEAEESRDRCWYWKGFRAEFEAVLVDVVVGEKIFVVGKIGDD